MHNSVRCSSENLGCTRFQPILRHVICFASTAPSRYMRHRARTLVERACPTRSTLTPNPPYTFALGVPSKPLEIHHQAVSLLHMQLWQGTRLPQAKESHLPRPGETSYVYSIEAKWP